jgi:hypothetical protein
MMGLIVVGQSSGYLFAPPALPGSIWVNNALANPQLSSMTLMAPWRGTMIGRPTVAGSLPAPVRRQNSGLAGAILRSQPSRDLAPGNYTAIAQGVNGGTSVASSKSPCRAGKGLFA